MLMKFVINKQFVYVSMVYIKENASKEAVVYLQCCCCCCCCCCCFVLFCFCYVIYVIVVDVIVVEQHKRCFCIYENVPIPVSARSKAWVCDRSLAGIAGCIPPGVWMFVFCECCVLSVRGLWIWMITRPEESYRVLCVQWLWTPNPVMGGHDPESGRSATGVYFKKN